MSAEGFGSDLRIFLVPDSDPDFSPDSDPPTGRIVAGMATCNDTISSFIAHVEAVGSTTAGSRLTRRWLVEEAQLAELAMGSSLGVNSNGSLGWLSAGDVAAVCRGAGRDDQERIVGCLCRLGASDELARLTIVSGLAARLASVLAGWSRAGAASWELDGLASDLLSACWSGVVVLAESVAAGAAPPRNLVWYLIDGTVEAVRVPRRRERRCAALHSPLLDAVVCGFTSRSGEEDLALALADAVRDGRLTRAAAAPLFLTRAAGFDVGETARRLGCTPASVRAVRSRAARRLAATV